MKNVVHIRAKLDWKWNETRAGNYVAACDAIGQTVQAKRFDELISTINEVLDSTFSELLSTGELDQFLTERGWQKQDGHVTPSTRNVRFDVPFNLTSSRARGR